jgi:hypothetical protein
MLKHSFGFNAIESSEDLKSGRSHASMSEDHLNLRSFATGPLPPPAFVTTTKHLLLLLRSSTLLFPENAAHLVLEEEEEEDDDDDEVDEHDDDAEENARALPRAAPLLSIIYYFRSRAGDVEQCGGLFYL